MKSVYMNNSDLDEIIHSDGAQMGCFPGNFGRPCVNCKRSACSAADYCNKLFYGEKLEKAEVVYQHLTTTFKHTRFFQNTRHILI